jgi:tripartite-type tricarboxylate transporter receptor subunit TctC
MARSRSALLGAVSIVGFACGSADALSQTSAYPSRTLRLVVPNVPGGASDFVARIIQPHWAEQFGQSVVVDNRGGAATNIGTEHVARAAPDGYTVLIATTPHAINPTLFGKLPFDPIKDFTMISQLALTQTVLVVHPSLPVKNVKELIALAKARPGQLTAATSAGNSQYLAVEMLKSIGNGARSSSLRALNRIRLRKGGTCPSPAAE